MEGYPTMTLHELAEAFRANLVRVSEDNLGQMILEGKFPFAVGTGGAQGTYIIFKEAFYDWLSCMTNRPSIKI